MSLNGNKIDRGEVDLTIPTMFMNTNKTAIFKTLLGLNSKTNTDNLAGLVNKYYKGNVNKDFTSYDLEVLSKLIDCNLNLKFDIKKNEYIRGNNKRKSYIYEDILLYGEEPRPCVLGASSINHSVWFHFKNDASDVCNGDIYLRTSSLKTLTKHASFEINPFIASGLPNETRLVGNNDSKIEMTWNPNWLFHTLMNMEKFIFQKYCKP